MSETPRADFAADSPHGEAGPAEPAPPSEAAGVDGRGRGPRRRGGGGLAFRAQWLPMGVALGALVGLVVKELELPALISYDGSREVLVVVISLLVGVVWALGLHRVVGLAVAGAMALWCLVAFTPLCAELADGLVVSDILEDADAVFVSQSALPPGESGRTESWRRLFYGAELMARGKAPIMVVSASAAEASGDEPQSMLERHGLDEDHLLLTAATGNTHEEALELARLCQDRNWDLVIVVTSPIHSRRIAATMAREEVRVLLSPTRETRYDLADLSRARDRIAAFGSVIHERMGTFVYGLRGWL